MSAIDLRIRQAVSYYGSIVFVVFILVRLVVVQWQRVKRKLYRSHLIDFETECSDLALDRKNELFGQLRNVRSKDAILRSLRCIRILEIGVKTGENIQYYPNGARFIGVDRNKKLADYLTSGERSRRFSHVRMERLMTGDGSSLRPIPTGCVDVVVTTRSLCSANSVRRTLSEIRRVLAPGGKYLFLEHVPDPAGSIAQRAQIVLTRTKIWPGLFGNCRLDVDPIDRIKRAGFKDIRWNYFSLDGCSSSRPNLLFLTRRHVIGTATG